MHFVEVVTVSEDVEAALQSFYSSVESGKKVEVGLSVAF